MASAPALDDDRPWPGLAAYEEEASEFFRGRADEAAELARRIRDEAVTVLYGKSGLGKSSLLRAGVFPLLRPRGLLPFIVRLRFEDGAPALAEQMAQRLFEELTAAQIAHPLRRADESLWEYLHRESLDFLPPTGRGIRPLFVLDQFEEVFTLGRRVRPAVLRFQEELADLAENRLPAELAAKLDALDDDDDATRRLDLHAQPAKFVLSLREDFIADLEGWAPAMPSLRRNRMRLLPMGRRQATQAVHNPHTQHLLDVPAAGQIVDFLATTREAGLDAEAAVIEPSLLSLFCAGVNERRIEAGQPRIDEALIATGRNTIIGDFYRRSLADQPERVHAFLEDQLVTDQGFRNSYAIAQAVAAGLATPEQIDLLVQRRLLRKEHHLGAERVELTHDLLTAPALEGRKARALARDEARSRRVRVRNGSIAAGLVVTVLGLAVALWWAIDQGRKADLESRRAQSRAAAEVARRTIDENREAAVLIGAEAVKIAPTAEARQALIDVMAQAWPMRTLTAAMLGDAPKAIALSADGTRLAVLVAGGQLSLWDTARRRWDTPLWTQPVADPGWSAGSLGFTQDGTRLAVAHARGIVLHDTANGNVAGRVDTGVGAGVDAPPENLQLVVSADGSTMATLDIGGTARIGPAGGGPGGWATVASPNGWAQIALSADGRQITGVEPVTLDAFVAEGRAGKGWALRKLAPGRCDAKRSVSPGPGTLWLTLSPALCRHEVQAVGGAPDSVHERFEDTLSSPFGGAVVAMRRRGDLRILRSAEWDGSGGVDVRGVGAHREYGDSLLGIVTVSEDGRRAAVVVAGQVQYFAMGDKWFLAPLEPGSAVLAPDLSWAARVRSVGDASQVEMVRLRGTGDGLPQPLPALKLASEGAALQAADGALVVTLGGDAGEETRVIDPATGALRMPPLPGAGEVVGAAGQWLFIRATREGREPVLLRLSDGSRATPWAADGDGKAPKSLRVHHSGDALVLAAAPDPAKPYLVNARVVSLQDGRWVPRGSVTGIDRRVVGHFEAVAGPWRLVTTLRRPLTRDADLDPDPGPPRVAQRSWTLAPDRVLAFGDGVDGVGGAPAAAVAPAADLRLVSPRGRFTLREEKTSDGKWQSTLVRKDGTPVRKIQVGPDRIEAAFSPTERWLATYDARRVRIFDLASGDLVMDLAIPNPALPEFVAHDAVLVVQGEDLHERWVPLEAEFAVRMAGWMVPRSLSDAERCLYGLPGGDCSAVAQQADRSACRKTPAASAPPMPPRAQAYGSEAGTQTPDDAACDEKDKTTTPRPSRVAPASPAPAARPASGPASVSGSGRR